MAAYEPLQQEHHYNLNWKDCSETLKATSSEAVDKMIKLRTDCNMPNLGS